MGLKLIHDSKLGTSYCTEARDVTFLQEHSEGVAWFKRRRSYNPNTNHKLPENYRSAAKYLAGNTNTMMFIFIPFILD